MTSPSSDSLQWEVTRFARDGSEIWQKDLNPATFNGEIRDIAIAPDGALIVAGSVGTDMAAARLDIATGALDTAFNDGAGVVRSPMVIAGSPDPQQNQVSVNQVRLAILPDGRFYVLGGLYYLAPEADDHQLYFLARYFADGRRDPAFKNAFYPALADAPVQVDNVTPSGDTQSDLSVSGADAIVEDPVYTGHGIEVRVWKFDGGPMATLSSKGTLRVIGSDGGDAIGLTVRHRDGRLVIRAAHDGDSLIRSFAPRQVKRIQIFGRFGDDTLLVGPGVGRAAYLDGGAGNDSITGGDGNDYLVGGTEDDLLIGGGGDDLLIGNAGDDRLLGSAGNDTLFGNAGRDTLGGAGGHDWLFGGQGADHLYGGDGQDDADRDSADTIDGVEALL